MKIKDIIPEIEGKTIKLKIIKGWQLWGISIKGSPHSIYTRNFTPPKPTKDKMTISVIEEVENGE